MNKWKNVLYEQVEVQAKGELSLVILNEVSRTVGIRSMCCSQYPDCALPTWK